MLERELLVLHLNSIELLGTDDGLSCVVDEDIQLSHPLLDICDEGTHLALREEITLDYKQS